MRKRTAVIAGGIALAATLGVYAGNSNLVGRDVVRDGALSSESGTLDYRDQEWFLDTGDASYQLMMGRYGHTLDLPYEEGAEAEVEGFSMKDYMTPISVETAGEELEFWHRDRYPLWAGEGERRNAAESRETRRPDDARGLELASEPEQKRVEAQETIRRGGRFDVDEDEPAPSGRPQTRRGPSER